jgi:membrane-associated phospholipid phosphatase
MKLTHWLKGMLIFATAVILYFSQKFDLFFSGLFFDQNFYLQDTSAVYWIDKLGEYLICALYAMILGLWILHKTNDFHQFFQVKRILSDAKIYFLSVCFFVWCILLPLSFKLFFHRARPLQTDIFNGQCSFSAAFVKSFNCAIGDSFISGHTSLMMWLIALALVTPKKWQKYSFIFAGTIILLVAASRVLGGYHFFSDVYFAIVLVGLGILWTYKTIFLTKQNSIAISMFPYLQKHI